MRYHGLDLHKGSCAVSVRNEVGHEVRYVARVETGSYVATLGPQDSVALESGCGSFLWADRIQRRGARCIVIDPYRFRIIVVDVGVKSILSILHVRSVFPPFPPHYKKAGPRPQ